jgi:hypothetical protein
VTASCFSTPSALSASLAAGGSVMPRLRMRQLVAPAVVAGLLAALLLAPEQPQAQADICQRHNGTAACRVW